MDLTTLGLKKPLVTEAYDLQIVNDNTDKVNELITADRALINSLAALISTYHPPKTYLYNEGDECADLTGGWIAGFVNGDGVQSKEADHLQLTSTAVSTSYNTFVTTLPIDLTNVKTLYFDINVTSAASDNGIHLYATDYSNGVGEPVAFKLVNTANSIRTIHSIDVSAVTGTYYISAFVRGGNAVSAVSVYKIWAE